MECEVHLVDTRRKVGKYFFVSVLWRGIREWETEESHEWNQQTDLWQRYPVPVHQGGGFQETRILSDGSCCVLGDVSADRQIAFLSSTRAVANDGP